MSCVANNKFSYSLRSTMAVGDRIRERLVELGITQAELARRVELKQPTINALIRGNSRSSTHLHKIARVLKTTPAYLAGETDDPSAEAPDEQLTIDERDAVELLRRLSTRDREAVLQLARTLSNGAGPKPPAPPVTHPTLHERKQNYRGKGHE